MIMKTLFCNNQRFSRIDPSKVFKRRFREMVGFPFYKFFLLKKKCFFKFIFRLSFSVFTVTQISSLKIVHSNLFVFILFCCGSTNGLDFISSFIPFFNNIICLAFVSAGFVFAWTVDTWLFVFLEPLVGVVGFSKIGFYFPVLFRYL